MRHHTPNPTFKAQFEQVSGALRAGFAKKK